MKTFLHLAYFIHGDVHGSESYMRIYDAMRVSTMENQNIYQKTPPSCVVHDSILDMLVLVDELAWLVNI